MENKKILLLDGHSILNRAFYGVPDLTNSAGMHTNAVYGFLNIMFKFLDEEKPTHLAVAFDVKKPTFRHKMFSEYKGTRKGMPEELKVQVPIIKEILTSMGVTIMELPGYEADDVIGTIAKKAEKTGMDVTVITGDRDLLQLATDKILIRIPKTKKGTTEVENYYAKDVLEKYQVTPIEFIDLKALMGDTADNIPGVPSVGEKTATNLIVEYKNIENIYEHIEEISRKKLKEALETNKDLAVLSKNLATINIESPVEIPITEMVMGDIFTKEALELIKKLEFKSLVKKFDVNNKQEKLELNPIIIDDFNEVSNIFEKATKNKKIGLYVSGIVSINKLYYEIFSVCIALSQEEIYIINKQWFITDDILSNQIEKLLSNDSLEICTFNLKNLLKYVKTTDYNKINVFDAEIAAYILNPIKDSYGYDDVARDYLDTVVSSRDELLGKLKDEKAIEEINDKFNLYLGYQALIALISKDNLINKLNETEQLNLYNEVEMPLVYSLNRLEKHGILVEKNELTAYGLLLGEKILKLESEIYSEVGEEFNINSPKQLGEILFVKLGIKGGKKTKTGYSTSADILEKLAGDYPVISKILEYRQLSKLKSTYADGLVNYISNDGRIHGTFNQTITATGRISSTEPNLQNIPIRMEMGKLFRKIFVPKEGFVFIDADYSQIELRVLAHCSNDENLIEAYKSSQDIHRITASKVFNTPFSEVTELQRRNAKAVNFGIVYGISSFGLSQDLSITRKEASEYIEQYFKTYPNIKTFLDKLVNDAKENGYVQTLLGRRRPVTELSSSNFMQRAFGERIAMNSPIQGTAADIIKIAMIKVDEELRAKNLESKIVLQVHDELLIEAKEEEADIVKEILLRNMKNAMNLRVDLEVELLTGKNWLEAH